MKPERERLLQLNAVQKRRLVLRHNDPALPGHPVLPLVYVTHTPPLQQSTQRPHSNMNITRRIHLNPQSKGNLGRSFEVEFRVAWLDRLMSENSNELNRWGFVDLAKRPGSVLSERSSRAPDNGMLFQ